MEISKSKSTDTIKERGGVLSISDSLAAMFLKKSIEKGNGFEIPSLGIKIEGLSKDKDEVVL